VRFTGETKRLALLQGDTSSSGGRFSVEPCTNVGSAGVLTADGAAGTLRFSTTGGDVGAFVVELAVVRKHSHRHGGVKQERRVHRYLDAAHAVDDRGDLGRRFMQSWLQPAMARFT
jgi:hypothetical protein